MWPWKEKRTTEKIDKVATERADQRKRETECRCREFAELTAAFKLGDTFQVLGITFQVVCVDEWPDPSVGCWLVGSDGRLSTQRFYHGQLAAITTRMQKEGDE